MVALFKDRSPAAIMWLFILSIIVHSNFFIDFPDISASKDDGLISLFLQKYFSGLSPIVIILLYHGLVLIQALRLNHLFTDQRMYTRSNYLVAMVYILLTGIFKEWSNLSPALIDNILVIWLFAKTVRLYNCQDPKTLIFNIGLIIGLSILFYHPSALLVLVACFALMVVRPFQITEWLVLLMGTFSPFYFLASYLYLTDQIQFIKAYLPEWGLNLPDITVTPSFFITVGIIVIVLFTGLFYWQKESLRGLIQIRKNWNVLLVMLLVMLPIPFINKNAHIDSLLLWIVPASPFMAKGFLTPKKNTFPALMFWLMVAIAILNNWDLIEW